MPFETWGTFSVTDHLGPRAFVADVILYDRLVIPVPDAQERERWSDLGRQPDILERKLAILNEPARRSGCPERSLVQPLAWTESFRKELDSTFPNERAKARQADTDRALGHSLDRGILAEKMRSGDYRTPEIVPAYTSYDAMESDLKPVVVRGGR